MSNPAPPPSPPPPPDPASGGTSPESSRAASPGERFGAAIVEGFVGVTLFFATMALWAALEILFGLGASPREVVPVDEAYQDLQPVYSFFGFLESGAEFLSRVVVRATVTFPLV